MKPSRLIALLFVVALAGVAAAKPPFLKVLMAAYKIKPESKIGKARCLNCHTPPGPPLRNEYGKAIESALRANHARMVTPDMLKSVENQKSADGMTYAAKIKKDLVPGQPKNAKGKLTALHLPSSSSVPLIMLMVSPLGLLLARKR